MGCIHGSHPLFTPRSTLETGFKLKYRRVRLANLNDAALEASFREAVNYSVVGAYVAMHTH